MGLILPKNAYSAKNAYVGKNVKVSESNGQKVETLYNSDGQVLKRTIFVDKNKDGKYDMSEAVSIKFYDVNSKSANTREYKDLNNDGNYDEVVESDWTGFETIKRHNGNGNPNDYKMCDVYGSKSDTIGEWFKEDMQKLNKMFCK